MACCRVVLWIGFFIALWCHVRSKPSAVKCGGFFNGSRGNLHTPNYPHTYDHDIQCQWTIEVAPGNVVQLSFKDFDVESFDGDCDIDKVHVRDGRDENSPLLGSILCGQTTPEMITSSGRYLTIYFVSDYISDGGRGFNADYQALPASEGNTCVTNACGGTIESTACQIQSPGFPISFESSLNCSWTIKAPHPSHKISFRFIDLDLNAVNSLCKDNNVTIYDGNSINAPVIHESLCDISNNRLQDRSLVSTGPTVVMRFRTSDSQKRRGEINGFNAQFKVLNSQGEIVLPTTTPVLTSPSSSTTASTTSTSTTTTSGNKTRMSTSTSIDTKPPKEESEIIETTTTKEKTIKTLKASPISSPAAMSGLVIGIIVVVVVIVLAILLMVAFKHWKKRNALLSRNLRDEDARSDVNTLLSSTDSREFTNVKKNGSIVRRIEEVL